MYVVTKNGSTRLVVASLRDDLFARLERFKDAVDLLHRLLDKVGAVPLDNVAHALAGPLLVRKRHRGVALGGLVDGHLGLFGAHDAAAGGRRDLEGFCDSAELERVLGVERLSVEEQVVALDQEGRLVSRQQPAQVGRHEEKFTGVEFENRTINRTINWTRRRRLGDRQLIFTRMMRECGLSLLRVVCN